MFLQSPVQKDEQITNPHTEAMGEKVLLGAEFFRKEDMAVTLRFCLALCRQALCWPGVDRRQVSLRCTRTQCPLS